MNRNAIDYDRIAQASLPNRIALLEDSGPLDAADQFEVVRTVNGKRSVKRATAQRMATLITGVGFDVANVLDYVQAGDPDHDAALTRALATGLPVRIPYNEGATYNFSSTHTLDDNDEVYCDDGKANISVNTSGSLFTATNKTNVNLLNLHIDAGTHGTHIVILDGCTDCFIYNVDTRRAGSDGIHMINTNTRIVIERGHSDTCGAHGVYVADNATFCTVTRRKFTSNVGFGCIFTGAGTTGIGPSDCEFTYNHTLVNGIELLGVTYECLRIRVHGNHAEGTGDNGISITGSGCAITGNVCRANWHNGIAIYGSRNAVSGNTCTNNGQRFNSDASDWAGIQINNGFGGAAYDNAVGANVCYDDQASLTQGWGVHIAVNLYAAWVTSTVTAVRTYRFNGNNVYVSTSAGTTGASPPVHTSGSVSDGGVTWKWLFGLHTDAGAKGPCNNAVSGNSLFNSRIRDWRDESTNYNAVTQGVRSLGSTPVNVVSAYGGDVITRYDVTTPYVGMYIKPTGTTKDKTLWTPVQMRASGALSARWTGAAGLEGAQYWNTDRNRLEINAGSNLSAAWLDSLGKKDVNNNVTAAGSTITDATQLEYCDNAIQSASAGTGVKLPIITHVNQRMFVFNPSGGTPNIYPGNGSQSIDALSAGAAFTTAAGGKYEFIACSTGQWRSFKSA